MNISSLEKMEVIVSKSDNLSWNGWDVVESKEDPGAWTKTNAAFVNGKWYRTNKYNLTESGWTIPDRLAKKNG